MAAKKVLIVGGTGHFGRLLAADIRNYSQCDLIVADRQTANLLDPVGLEKALAGVFVAICAAGPFQSLPTSLIEICLRRGIHYIDFSDDRLYVRQVQSLVKRERNPPAVCTGWSTVSALSGVLSQIAS